MENSPEFSTKLARNRSCALIQYILSLLGLLPACAGLCAALSLGLIPGAIVAGIFWAGYLLLKGYYRIHKGRILGSDIWLASFCYNGVLLLVAMVVAFEPSESSPLFLLLMLPSAGVVLGGIGICRTRKIEWNSEI